MKKIITTILVLFLSATAFADTNYLKHPNCQLAYPMDSDESPLTDQSQNSNSGTLKAANEPDYLTDSPSGHPAGSYDFDATDDYINSGNDSSLADFSSFTWVGWVKSDTISAVAKRLFSKGEQKLAYLYGNAGSEFIAVEINTDGDYRFASTAEDVFGTGWTHVAFTYSSGSAPTVYINAVDATNTSSAGTGTDTAETSDAMYIGNRAAGDRTWGGQLKDTAYFDAVLTQIQIQEIMTCGLSGELCRVILSQ